MLSSLLWLSAAAAATTDAVEPAEQTTLDVITVEASKRPLATTEIATRVTVIDAERIQRELAQNIDDLVRYEPGVDIVDQGSRFGLTGFSIRGIGGNRVRTEIDGVATSDAFSIGSFSNASRDFVDVESIKQLEIVRGPSSAVFGSNAIGGVVSYVTKGPEDYLDGSEGGYVDVNAGYNSVDESTVAGFTGAIGNGDIAGMLRFNARDGAERDFPGANPLETQSVNVLSKLNFGDIRSGGVGLTLEYFNAENDTDVDSREGVQDLTPFFGFPFIVDTTEVAGDDERERTRFSVGQEWRDGRFGTDYLRWRAFWQNSETSQDTVEVRETLVFGQPGAESRERAFRFEQDLLGFEVNAVNEFALGRVEHEVAYGIEYETADTSQIRDGVVRDLISGETSNTVGPDEFPVRDFPESNTEAIGIYVQDRISLGPVTLVPGLRWDRYELDPEPDTIFFDDNPGITPVAISDDEISPKLGVLWDVSDSWQLYAQYAEGFRAPPVNDVNVGFTNLQFGYTAIPNPDLRSESSEGYELGLRFGSEAVSFDVSAFSTRYDDFIESFALVGVENGLLIFQSVNVDEVEIEGVEMQGRIAPAAFPDGLSIRFSAAYADGENRETGAPINSVAPLNGVLGLEYTQPAGRWGGSLIARGAEGADDLDESDNELLEPAGYVIYDAIGYWRVTDQLRLSAGVYNLADREYTAYLDVQGLPADTANPERFQRPGRNFSVAVDWNF